MKSLSAVRGAAFLMTVLATADVAETRALLDRSTRGRYARCEHCGETGPTVPATPVVYRVRPAAGFEVGNADAAVRFVRPNVTLPAWEEFGLAPARPAVGAVMTR